MYKFRLQSTYQLGEENLAVFVLYFILIRMMINFLFSQAKLVAMNPFFSISTSIFGSMRFNREYFSLIIITPVLMTRFPKQNFSSELVLNFY